MTLLAVAVGFGRTYAAPMAVGTFSAPIVVHVHGAFAATWILLFIVQPLLVSLRPAPDPSEPRPSGAAGGGGVRVTMV
ncbi:MAG: hypothetical protein IPK12_17905 [Gemmatimonadetes bacterium]|nr:hypothetical protein [Gemmatimonadota bacterium]